MKKGTFAVCLPTQKPPTLHYPFRNIMAKKGCSQHFVDNRFTKTHHRLGTVLLIFALYMRKIIFILTVFIETSLQSLCFSQTSPSKNVVFSGAVLDYVTGKPIPNFGIHLMKILQPKRDDSLIIATKTDTAGKFRIDSIPKVGTYIQYISTGYISGKDYQYGGQFQMDVTSIKKFQTIKYATINIDSLAPFLLNMNVKQAIKLAHFNEDWMGKGGTSSFALSTTGCEEGWTTTSVAATIGDGREVTFILEPTDKIKYANKTVQCIRWTDTKSGAVKMFGQCGK